MCIYIIVSTKVVQFVIPALLRVCGLYAKEIHLGIWYVVHFTIIVTIGVFLYTLRNNVNSIVIKAT